MYGVKYFPCANTPRKESDGRFTFLGKGPGAHLVVINSKSFIVAARCCPGKGQTAGDMNGIVELISKRLG